LEREVYQIFDLRPRGLTNVFCSLLDRVKEVKGPTHNKNSDGKGVRWISRSETVHAIILAAFHDSFEKAHIMMLGYLECLDILLHKEMDWVSIMRNIGFYFCLALRDELEEFLKYQTASLVALSLSNSPDKAPAVVKRGRWLIGHFMPCGYELNRIIRRECVIKRTDFGIQMAFSLYTTKNLAPTMTPELIKKAMDKNLKALCTERTELPDRIDLIDQVRRTVKELHFLSTNPTPTYDTAISAADQRNKEIRANGKLGLCPKREVIPSLSACYEQARSKGGSLGYLLNHCGFAKQLISDLAPRILLCYAQRKDRFCQPVPIYGVLDDDDLTELMRPKNKRPGDFSDFGYDFGSKVLVRREPIPEPFKIRIISKGEAIPYQHAHNYQPFFWKLLQLSNAFVLTGRPLQNEDINRILRWGKSTLTSSMIVSGDYSAATDNLHPVLCNAALDEIVRLWKIPFEDAVNLKQCLTGHIIDDNPGNYKKWKLTGRMHDMEGTLRNEYFRIYGKAPVEDIFTIGARLAGQDIKNLNDHEQLFLQKWGQLMGSFLSFPILCIINYAVTRFSMERAFEKTITILDDALLVNGDDVIFTIPDGQYQTWVRNVTMAGLSPSIGKNYISRRWGVINSRLYDCGQWHLSTEDVSVKPVPLVKMNLVHITGHDSTERTKGTDLFVGDALMRGGTLEGRLLELIDGWDDDMRENLLARAYRYARPILKLLPDVSWCLPKCLGGLGLPMLRDTKVSLHHKKIATMIACTCQKTRRDLVKLSWLRQPGQAFCEKTNSQISDVYDALDVPMTLSTSKTEDYIYGRTIKSNLGFGIDLSVIDSTEVIQQWKEMYHDWLKRIDKIVWVKPDDINNPEATGMRVMGFGKLMSFGKDKVWTRFTSVSPC
jgi:hypothetical protein